MNELIPLSRPTVARDAIERLTACLESGWLGYGPLCKALECNFETRGGWALATVNCTAALHLAARLCNRLPRSRVLVPGVTFVSTAMAFRYAGLDVALVDVDPLTGLVDPNDVAREITGDTTAVVAVHLFGQRAPVEELRQLCDLHGLVLIEDCAHRIDLLDAAAPIGDIACYSFNAVKEASGGEGGLIWCKDLAMAQRARTISNLGLTIDTPGRASTVVHRDYEFVDDPGLKLRGFDLSAALILANLETLSVNRVRRRNIFAAFDAALSQDGPIKRVPRHASDSYLMYVVRTKVEVRQQLRYLLASNGISTSIHYPSLSRHPAFSRRQLDRSEILDREVVTLPCYPDMTDEQVDRITEALAISQTSDLGAHE